MPLGHRSGLALLLAVHAAAQTWPTRAGESGLIDIPDGETMGLGGGAFIVEMRYERAEGARAAIGPSPVAALLGLGGAELGLSLREGGAPDDPRPSAPLFATVLKLRILRPKKSRPALALGGLLDRVNRDPAGAARLSLSMGNDDRRFAAFAGPAFNGDGSTSATGGLAAAMRATRKTEGVVQGLYRDDGVLVGSAVRWTALPNLAFGLGADVELSTRSIRASLSVAFLQPARPERERRVSPRAAPAAESTAPEEPEGPPQFKDERPRFRLRIRKAGEKPRPHHPAPPPESDPGAMRMRPDAAPRVAEAAIARGRPL